MKEFTNLFIMFCFSVLCFSQDSNQVNTTQGNSNQSSNFAPPPGLGDPNLLDTSSWTVGSGAVPGFSLNGSTSENSRVIGNNHIGQQVVLWEASPDAASNADGGWNTSYMNIDNSKSYRFTVWIKKTNSKDGKTYFGCQQWQSSGSIFNYTILNLNGTANTNPYFWADDLPILNRWYLLVGYLHKKSHSSSVSLGKIYDGVTGEPVIDMKDFKLANTTTRIRHRAYLYYDTNTQDRQYFYAPRLEVLDGTEWTLEELLSLNPNSELKLVYDNSGNQKQRFYCSQPGCQIPVPPTGRVTNDEVAINEPVEDSNEELTQEEIDDAEISLYPNPTNGNLTMTLRSNTGVSVVNKINIYSTSGKLVKQFNSNSHKQLEMDFSDLSNGLYMIHIHLSNGTSITEKIIKN